MVKSRNPLGHSHVVCILGFEQELENAPSGCSRYTPTASRQTTVGWDLQKIPVAIGNQPEGNLVAHEGGLRRSKNRANQIVVKKRRPHRELRLLQREYPRMIPRALLEDSEGNGVSPEKLCLCLPRLAH